MDDPHPLPTPEGSPGQSGGAPGTPRPSHRPAVPPPPATYAAPAEYRPIRPGAPGQSSAESQPRAFRDPGNPLSLGLAWIAVLALVAITVSLQWGLVGPPPSAARQAASLTQTPGDVPPPAGLMLLMGRMAIGFKSLSPGSELGILPQLNASATTPVDRLRAAIIVGEIVGPGEAVTRLAAIEGAPSASDAPPNTAAPVEPAPDAAAQDPAPAVAPAEPLPDWLVQDRDILLSLYADGADALTPEQRALLRDHHAWFGDLALSIGAPPSDPVRARVLAAAHRVVAVIIALFLVAAGAFIVGLVLFIIALFSLASGSLRPRYAPPAPGGSAYLEAFALFLAGFLAISVASGLIQHLTGVDASRFLIWLLPLCAFWPRLRGAPRDAWRYALGWHKGSGVFREIGAGIIGYLAGLPIFALGVAISAALVFIQGLVEGPDAQPPSHPIINELGSGGWMKIAGVLLLATVWAPLTEETLFRGAFYHHLRARWSVLVSALLVALVFALIHPQGWVAVPALMGLAVSFALIREWRGSLIGSIAAHAIHNGVVLVTLIIALS